MWSPSFFSTGGQYVKVIGFPGALTREAIRLHGVYVDVGKIGTVLTSNNMITFTVSK